MIIGGKKEQTGRNRDFSDVSGKINNGASELVYTGKEQQWNKRLFVKIY